MYTCVMHTLELYTYPCTCVLKIQAKQMQFSLWGGEGQVLLHSCVLKIQAKQMQCVVKIQAKNAAQSMGR